jgi:hypothetical protein
MRGGGFDLLSAAKACRGHLVAAKADLSRPFHAMHLEHSGRLQAPAKPGSTNL